MRCCGAGCPFALDTACGRSPLLYLGSVTRSCAGLSLLCPVAGDSACSIPPQTIPQQCLDVIRDWTPKIAKELKVIGLINIQYAIQDNQVCRAADVYIAMLCVTLASEPEWRAVRCQGRLSLLHMLSDQPIHIESTVSLRCQPASSAVQASMLEAGKQLHLPQSCRKCLLSRL